MKTCKTCAAWGGNRSGEQGDASGSYYCHKTSQVATSNDVTTCDGDWWCLDHVPITDEQTNTPTQDVLDRIVKRIQTQTFGTNDPIDETYRICLAIIEEERNRE